jgi:hypothetical protein
MRLYDQASGTPSQFSSSLNCKKWVRPKAFLPDTERATSVILKLSSDKPKHLSAKDEVNPSVPSLSNNEKQRMLENNFLFDIDEESSMISSSTISTHTSCQGDLQSLCRFGVAKSLPSTENGWKTEKGNEDKPLEVLHSTSVKKTMTDPPKMGDHSFEQFKSLQFPRNGSSQDEFSHETQPTLVESSSEESPWHDFTSEDFSENPFHGKAISTAPTEEAKRVVFATPSRPIPAADPFNISFKNGHPHNLAKYSAMMIRGHSVSEVTKIMAKDQVHPSIISLVMIAASENQQ